MYNISYWFAYSWINQQFYLTHHKTLSGTIITHQSEPGSNVNEGVIPILQSSRIGASPSDAL